MECVGWMGRRWRDVVGGRDRGGWRKACYCEREIEHEGSDGAVFVGGERSRWTEATSFVMLDAEALMASYLSSLTRRDEGTALRHGFVQLCLWEMKRVSLAPDSNAL